MSTLDITQRLTEVYTPFKGENHPNAKKVIILDYNTLNILGEFPTAQSASDAFKINFKNISACCRGSKKTCGKSPSNDNLLSVFSTDWNEIKSLNYSIDEIHRWKINKYSK